MQNEPNSNNEGNKLKDPPEAAQLNNQSSIIDNQWKGEPNSEAYAEPKAKSRRAGKPKFQTHRPYANFKLTALMPVSPNGSRVTRDESRIKNAKRTQFVKEAM
ncbi:MAG: hypothetical protein ACYSWP_06405 [Planctomycetota bacterium]|jgi:hypothetical protein